jgi:hypothetical protein
MGIPDTSLLDLLDKVRSWISWGASDLSASCLSANFPMPNNGLSRCVVSVIQTITSCLMDTIAKVVASGCVSIV